MRRRFRTITLALVPSLILSACGESEAASSPVLTSDPGEETNPSFSPDGERVAFTKLTAPGNTDVYVMELGRPAVNLTADYEGGDTHPAFSPDGQTIAFQSSREGGGIFVIPAAGGTARRIVDEGFNPSWTPDGSEIFYATTSAATSPYNAPGGSVVKAVNVATGATRDTDGAYAVEPAVSPNGLRVAFWAIGDRSTGSVRDIWTMKLDGTEVTRVTDDAAVDWSPVWSPEGDQLYFASDRDGGAMKIFRIAIDEATGRTTGAPELVTNDEGAPIRGHLAMSAEGDLTYIDRRIDRTLYRQALDPATGQPQGQGSQLDLGGVAATGFAVSPDGSRVLFGTGDYNQEDLYVVNADGSGLQQLTNDAYRDRVPTWFPDGRRLGFRSDRLTETGQPTVAAGYGSYVMNVDGTEVVQVGEMPGSNGAPSWSPDGRRMFVTSTIRSGGARMFYMDANGSGQREVETFEDGFGTPVWSPDSRQVAYGKGSGVNFAAFTLDMTRAGASPQPLPELSFVPISWSPDGRMIAGDQLAAGRPARPVVLDLASGQYTELAEEGNGATWLADGRHLVFLSDGGTRLRIVDRTTKEMRDVVGVQAPNTLTFDVSRDGSVLFYLVTGAEADVYQIRR